MEARMLTRCPLIVQPHRCETGDRTRHLCAGSRCSSAVCVFALLLFVGYFQVRLTEPASLTEVHLFLVSRLSQGPHQGLNSPFDPFAARRYPQDRDRLYFPSFDWRYRPCLN